MRIVRYGVQVNNPLDGIKVLIVDKEDVGGRSFPGYLYEGNRYFYWDTFDDAEQALNKALRRGMRKTSHEISTTHEDLEFLMAIRAGPGALGNLHDYLCSLCELREKYKAKITEIEVKYEHG